LATYAPPPSVCALVPSWFLPCSPSFLKLQHHFNYKHSQIDPFLLPAGAPSDTSNSVNPLYNVAAPTTIPQSTHSPSIQQVLAYPSTIPSLLHINCSLPTTLAFRSTADTISNQTYIRQQDRGTVSAQQRRNSQHGIFFKFCDVFSR
jgi:hypothetical protein